MYSEIMQTKYQMTPRVEEIMSKTFKAIAGDKTSFDFVDFRSAKENNP